MGAHEAKSRARGFRILASALVVPLHVLRRRVDAGRVGPGAARFCRVTVASPRETEPGAHLGVRPVSIAFDRTAATD